MRRGFVVQQYARASRNQFGPLAPDSTSAVSVRASGRLNQHFPRLLNALLQAVYGEVEGAAPFT